VVEAFDEAGQQRGESLPVSVGPIVHRGGEALPAEPVDRGQAFVARLGEDEIDAPAVELVGFSPDQAGADGGLIGVAPAASIASTTC
jgi:hypothetical protein